jgi:hypothetical protein
VSFPLMGRVGVAASRPSLPPVLRNRSMSHAKPDLPGCSTQRQLALSRWENEGGAGLCGPQEGSIPGDVQSKAPELTNAELVQLQIRVIALENVIIALLAQAPRSQIDLAREIAAYIVPRPGFTHHPLTSRAAAHIIQLVGRASHFRDMTPS